MDLYSSKFLRLRPTSPPNYKPFLPKSLYTLKTFTFFSKCLESGDIIWHGLCVYSPGYIYFWVGARVWEFLVPVPVSVAATSCLIISLGRANNQHNFWHASHAAEDLILLLFVLFHSSLARGWQDRASLFVLFVTKWKMLKVASCGWNFSLAAVLARRVLAIDCQDSPCGANKIAMSF